MKGILFNEFLNYVEETHSYTMVDEIIEESQLSSRGAYTSLGTYSQRELIQLINRLSNKIAKPASIILQEYGEYLFAIFVKKYPQFFKKKKSVFQFLEGLESHIHMEVKKLYEKTELPHFKCTYITPSQFEMIYTSSRPLADLAEGLIRGCIGYHGETISIVRENIPTPKGTKAKFILMKG